jgi:WD40 repeat protein
LVTGSYDNEVRIWNAASGALLSTLSGHTDYVASVAFAPRGGRVASGSWDTTARIWDVASGAVLHTFAHPDSVNSVAFDPAGEHLVVSAGQSVYVWDARSGGLVVVAGHSGQARDAVFSPDGTKLLTGAYDTTATIWQFK